MATFWKHWRVRSLDKKNSLLKFWYWAGRILPLTALALICFVLAFGTDTWLDYVLCGIAVIFATFAFTWWWWILDTVKKLYNLLQSAQDRFSEVIIELRDIKKDLNDSDRKRDKQDKDKS